MKSLAIIHYYYVWAKNKMFSIYPNMAEGLVLNGFKIAVKVNLGKFWRGFPIERDRAKIGVNFTMRISQQMAKRLRLHSWSFRSSGKYIYFNTPPCSFIAVKKKGQFKTQHDKWVLKWLRPWSVRNTYSSDSFIDILNDKNNEAAHFLLIYQF